MQVYTYYESIPDRRKKMGTRPLKDTEREDIEKKLKDAKEYLGRLSRSISDWEKTLKEGTVSKFREMVEK